MRPVRANQRHASCKHRCSTDSKSFWSNSTAHWKPISHASMLPGESEARYPTSLKRCGPGSACLPFSRGSQPWYISWIAAENTESYSIGGDMIRIDIPQRGTIELEHAVFDVN